jgi:hypothetical protein
MVKSGRGMFRELRAISFASKAVRGIVREDNQIVKRHLGRPPRLFTLSPGHVH